MYYSCQMNHFSNKKDKHIHSVISMTPLYKGLAQCLLLFKKSIDMTGLDMVMFFFYLKLCYFFVDTGINNISPSNC